MKSHSYAKKASELLRTLGQSTRVKILLAIGEGEACVCHLEAVLDQRQAYISQHLMALRKAGLLTTRRDGRYIFYRLEEPEVLQLIRTAGLLVGIPEDELEEITKQGTAIACACPHCAGDSIHIPTSAVQVTDRK